VKKQGIMRFIFRRKIVSNLVINANFETGWAPIHKLDGLLCLDCGDGLVDILGNNIASVEKAAGHVLSVARVTLDHLTRWLKTGVCYLLIN